MSKSRSRHPSKQASAASKSGSGRLAGSSTAKVAVVDASQSQEEETLPSSVAEEGTEDEATIEEVVAEEKQATSVATTAKAESATTEKSGSAARTVSSSSGKAAPAKVAARSVPNTPPLKPVPHTPVGASGRLSRDAAKYERRQHERQMRYLAERRRKRNRILITVSVILLVAIIGGGTWFLVHQSTSTPANTKAAQGTYQEPIFNTNYPPVDSVYCDELEQSVEHIHIYLSMFINGQASQLPAYIGIPQDSSGNSACYYWLHTHDSSGVVHIESPSTEVFTLGQFIDEWDQQFVSLGFPPELLLKSGWTIWVNGQKSNSSSFTSIPLEAHDIITLAYNSPDAKPVTTYNWNGL